jgi:hypothetical protein
LRHRFWHPLQNQGLNNSGTRLAFSHGVPKEIKKMKTKSNVRAGGTSLNHSETLVRDNGKNLKVRTSVRAGKRSA